MKNNTSYVGAVIVILLLAAGPVLAAPDRYTGDTAIYSSASNTNLRPNVLFIIDNSKATLNGASGAPYDKTKVYADHGYLPWAIYAADNQGDFSGSALVTSSTSSLENMICYNNNTIIGVTLLNAGTYAGSGTVLYPNLKKGTGVNAGKAVCDTAPMGANYALGNYLNYLQEPAAPTIVRGTIDGINYYDYRLIAEHTSSLDNQPPSGPNWADYWEPNQTIDPVTHLPIVDPATGLAVPPTQGLGVEWQQDFFYAYYVTASQRKIIFDALKLVVYGNRTAVNFGAMVYGDNNSGGKVIFPIQNVSSAAGYANFVAAIPGVTAAGVLTGAPVLSSNTGRPQSEALLDAGMYFRGRPMAISSGLTYSSPITKTCDKNYIILITNGLSNNDGSPQLAGIVGDYDHDNYGGGDEAPYGNGTHFLDDVAKFLYEEDNSSLAGMQRITTHTVLAFQASDSLVERAAAQGHGSYYNVYNAAALAASLGEILSNIVDESDTSFIAPVVPVSPENRTYSGSRVYMGFFKPQSNKYWLGNLKKYGLDNNNNIVDKNGNFANYLDKDGDGKEDRDTTVVIPAGFKDGSFRANAQSFWSASADAGSVDAGGAGSVLVDPTVFTLDPTGAATNARKIYTWLRYSDNLTDGTNAFTTLNTALTPTAFGYVATNTAAKTNIIKWLHGMDVWDGDGDLDKTEMRRWILGDILHSKPVVVNYQSYTAAQENLCDQNKSIIYVGANDGQLHAFRDCDGKELWSFIPPELLLNLSAMLTVNHYYYVDSTVSEFVYDADLNGTIDSGDKVVILFGARRGMGVQGGYGRGAYYALDVTNPSSPKVLWRLNQATPFGLLGETWSEPKVVKMKIGSSDKIVAIFGGGYDNCNEDARYGNTQTFPGTCAAATNANSGIVTSPSSVSGLPLNPRGTGLYFVEVATLSDAGIALTSGVTLIKRFNYGSPASTSALATLVPEMTFGIMSEVAPIDSDYDTYADKVYVGDAGGYLWRFNVGDSSTTAWTATRLFASNPGFTGFPPSGVSDGSKGRKIFYRPAVTIESDSIWVFFGTGDREHPLNRAVTDRMYAFIDRGQTTTLTEANLVDVTVDQLENGTPEEADAVRTALAGTTYSGWYIRLDQNSGEKVLALPTLFNKAIYFTTYTPNLTFNADPCLPGNLGTGRYYGMKFKTGEAALDLSTSGTGRADRSKNLGPGIPSGVVPVVSQSGDVIGLIGSGGTITTQEIKATGGIVPLYWRQK